MAAESRKLPWLNPGDRLVLGVVFAGLLAIFGVHHILRTGLAVPSAQQVTGTSPSHRIDINRAEWWELQALQGIGDKLAHDIVSHRNKHGAFASLDELVHVPGIGPKTLKRLRPHLKPCKQEMQNEKRL